MTDIETSQNIYNTQYTNVQATPDTKPNYSYISMPNNTPQMYNIEPQEQNYNSYNEYNMPEKFYNGMNQNVQIQPNDGPYQSLQMNNIPQQGYQFDNARIIPNQNYYLMNPAQPGYISGELVDERTRTMDFNQVYYYFTVLGII